MTRKLNNISRTAMFAWSPGHQLPMIATGTMAGAMDDSFSNASELEIFKLDLNPESNSLQTSFKISTASRFNNLAWGHVTSEKPYGIIAGGMENGELELWDSSVILDKKSASDALILRNSTHTGTLRTLDFNLFQSNLLASAGSNSEVFIWDLNNPSTPYTPGARSSKMDDISSVAWNCQVQHIVSTASTNGYTVVWDLRNKKEVMTLAHAGQNTLTGGRGSISAIGWHPNVATQIVTASDDDRNPIISLWDLRHAHSPEKTLAGHNKGVLDVSWCRQDSDLLISSGKDCKTLCWNPNTGELNGELYSNNKWTFEVNWSPRNPNLLASSSFDGSINVFSIQGSQDNTTSNQQAPTSDDPFDGALLAAAPSVRSFELKDPPKWLRRPIGASFGFSGKLVRFNNKLGNAAATAAASAVSGQAANINLKTISRPLKISTIETEPETVKRAEQLESATNSDVKALIEDRIQNASKDKNDWEVLKTLFSDNAREQLMSYLGFEKDQVMSAATALFEENKKAKEASENTKLVNVKNESITETVIEKDKELATPITDTASTLFGDSSQHETADGSFFGQILSQESSPIAADAAVVDPSSLLSGSATKNNNIRPFNLYPEGTTETDRLITRAIVLGDFESAVNVCLVNERFSDALILAICGGSDLLARTQKAYFESQSKKFAYLRLLEAIVEENLSSVVRDADLKEWASILVVLCTFADSKDFGSLCEVLGDRLLTNVEFSKIATLFYLAAGNLEKVTSIWISQFDEGEQLEDSATYGVRLQELVEKVTIFRKAIDYEDNATVTEAGEFALANLYDKYCEYAEFMASQGKLNVALKYINLTPAGYAAAKSKLSRGSVVRDRVFHASANRAGNYAKPSFPFEKRLLSSRESISQSNATAATVNQYAQNQQHLYNTHQPTAIVKSSISASTMQPVTNYYPLTATAQQQYTPYEKQTHNQQQQTNIAAPTANYYRYVSTVAFGQTIQQQQYDQVPTQYGSTHLVTSTTTTSPPPKASGAWNDPPLIASPKINKRFSASSGANTATSTTAVPVKRVTTPFANPPAAALKDNSSSPQQAQLQQQLPSIPPPPMNAASSIRGLGGPAQPPPPPSSNTTIGGYYSAHQQPQQFQSQQQRATPPPPPMNAMAPSPMMRGPPPQQNQRL